MFSRVRLCLGTALAVAALAAGAAASAATVSLSVDRFERPQLGTAQTAMSDYLGTATLLGRESFSGYKAWDGTSGTSNPQHTQVGSFASFGEKGSGHSVVGDPAGLQVRADSTMPWGRYTTSSGLGGHWLDSNDNLGMAWTVEGLGTFNTLAFFVLDAADVGGKFSIKVGDTLFSDIAGADGKLLNGNIQFVRILLSEAVSSLRVELMHDRSNDGFGVDGAAVALAPIPLPPAALLLVTGVAGLVGLSRRRRAV
jgi:hypothetical protein